MFIWNTWGRAPLRQAAFAPTVREATGALLGGLAVIAVALEATGPAIVLGGIAAWMITH